MRRTVLIFLGTCLLSAGCGAGESKRHPVEGQVMLQGKPLRGLSGTVRFVPDRDKGNNGEIDAGGPLDGEGRYRLSTRGKPGAAPGWYKVVVSAVPPGTGDREIVRPFFSTRFTGEATTPLSVEVVAEPGPGAYDLNVARN